MIRRRRLRVQTYDPGDDRPVRGQDVLVSEIDEHGVQRQLQNVMWLRLSVDARDGKLVAEVGLHTPTRVRRVDPHKAYREPLGAHHVDRYDDVVLGPAPEGTRDVTGKEKGRIVMGEFAFVNQSGRVSDGAVRVICQALSRQVEKFAYEWGLLQPVVAFYPAGSTPPATSWVVQVVDQPGYGEDGALAYHTAEGGRALARVFAGYILDNGGQLMTGSNSVASACSHEVLELMRDPPCTILVEMPLVGPDGKPYVRVAAEVCDPVQSGVDPYEVGVGSIGPDGKPYVPEWASDGTGIQRVDLSAYVLPAWEDPTNTGGPFSSDGSLTRAGEVAPGGYGAFEDAEGRVHQVMAKGFPEHLRALKANFGRAAKRLSHARVK